MLKRRTGPAERNVAEALPARDCCKDGAVACIFSCFSFSFKRTDHSGESQHDSGDTSFSDCTEKGGDGEQGGVVTDRTENVQSNLSAVV